MKKNLPLPLGRKIERDCQHETVKLYQPAYVNKVLQKFHLNKANSTNTLMNEAKTLSPNTDVEPPTSEQKRYQGITSCLMSSIVDIHIRPEIIIATSGLSRFAKPSTHRGGGNNPQISKGLTPREITYGGEDKLRIGCYSDSDWAGDRKSLKPISSYISTVVLSSTKLNTSYTPSNSILKLRYLTPIQAPRRS